MGEAFDGLPLTEMETTGPVAPSLAAFPARSARALKIDPAAIVASVQRRVQRVREDVNYGEWARLREQRYAKYRGWLAEKTWPWSGCSNAHLPVLQIAELRQNAGLHNVVMSLRPLLRAKATKRTDAKKEESITNLIDVQLFLDPGPDRAERVMSDYISSFLQDGNAVAYCPWVRDDRDIVDVHYRRAVPSGVDLDAWATATLQAIFPTRPLTVRVDGPGQYGLTFAAEPGHPAEAAHAEFTQRETDQAIEIRVRRRATLYDGPVMLPLTLDQVLVPTRSENLQPPSEANPNGAPYVVVLVDLSIDELRRGQGTRFNYLTDEGLETIEAKARATFGAAAAATDETDRPLQALKDEAEGREHRPPEARLDEEVAQVRVPCWMVFDQWDLDDDGQAEDALWLIAADAEVLCQAHPLTELWPATRPYRPLAEAVCLPVPGRWYGISLLELGEALSDLIKTAFDQMYDYGSITTLPVFFYGASSKMNADLIRLAPGEGYPIPGNPRDTLYFPNWPQKDQSFFFQVITLAFSFLERVMTTGDIQFGRVPTGKASALRTFGTTAALIQQGDVRADQLLLRLFGGLRQVATYFHAMNRHLLPPGREFRVLGWEGPESDAYRQIQDSREIDADVQFDFRPDFLLSNPVVLQQTMTNLLTIIATPLAFQLGISSPETFFQAVQDYIRAQKLDPKKYLRPPDPTQGPPILAEEAIGAILEERMPRGAALEGDAAHFEALHAFVTSDQYDLLTPVQVDLVRQYVDIVGQRVRRAQLVQAAAQFQQGLAQGGGGNGAGGAMTPMQEPALSAGAPAPEGTGVGS